MEGFYCSLCDHDNHEFIDTERSKILYSENFCRVLIENTLGPLRYIHEHFVKFANLSIGFMTKCNAKGEFLVNEQVPAKALFNQSEEYLLMIKKHEECKENRNEK